MLSVAVASNGLETHSGPPSGAGFGSRPFFFGFGGVLSMRFKTSSRRFTSSGFAMPQPLSKIAPLASHHYLQRDEADPKLAKLVLFAISLYARMDEYRGRILLDLLHARAKPAMAMYFAAHSDNLKIELTLAAAQAELNPDDFALAKAAFDCCKTAGKHRHRLAHWTWHQSDQIPDALIVADPRNRLELEADQVVRYSAEDINHDFDYMEHNAGGELDSSTLVYFELDLKEACDELERAMYAMLQLSQWLRFRQFAVDDSSGDFAPAAERSLEALCRWLDRAESLPPQFRDRLPEHRR